MTDFREHVREHVRKELDGLGLDPREAIIAAVDLICRGRIDQTVNSLGFMKFPHDPQADVAYGRELLRQALARLVPYNEPTLEQKLAEKE